MASLQLRSGSWRVIFRFRGLQHFVTIGEVEETEAQGVKARYEYLLRLLKQRLLTLPPGMDIVTFLRHDGKPADATPESAQPEITFAEFRDGYLKTIGNGAVEKQHAVHVQDSPCPSGRHPRRAFPDRKPCPCRPPAAYHPAVCLAT